MNETCQCGKPANKMYVQGVSDRRGTLEVPIYACTPCFERDSGYAIPREVNEAIDRIIEWEEKDAYKDWWDNHEGERDDNDDPMTPPTENSIYGTIKILLAYRGRHPRYE